MTDHAPTPADPVAASVAALPPILTVKETAKFLRLSAKGVRSMLQSGALSGALCGRHFRVPRAAVEALLRGETRPATPPEEPRPVIVTAVAPRGAAGRPRRANG